MSNYFDRVTCADNVVFASGNGGLFKYDSSGKLLWNTWIEGGAGSPALDQSGNIYVCGQANDYNACVSKLNSTGKWLWTTEIPILHPSSMNLVLDAAGNPVVQVDATNIGGVARFTATGGVQWTSQIAASFQNIAADATGGIYVVGSASQSLLGEPVTNNGFLMKYNSSGITQWVRRYTFPVGEGTSIAIDPSGALCVVGHNAMGKDCLYRYDSSGIPLDTVSSIMADSEWSVRGLVFSNNNLYTLGEVNGPGFFDVYINKFAVTGVPEPSAIVLLGIGAISVLAYARRRRKDKK